MAIRNVPGGYLTIQDAVNDSISGDTILISSFYQDNESVYVTVDNLIFGSSLFHVGEFASTSPAIR